jgi:alkanesulfonate monooxygenase SsuD/methylene tetrahydromethanopterin reductase-like flavin-dependent oxidoreductase (luciferase family)
MKPEFTALGVPRSQRGAITDATLDLLRRCFAAEDDVVVEHEQPFLFRPHPPAPPIFVGGHGDHALARAARFGDGWMPMQSDPDALRPDIERLREMADAAGRATPEVVCFGAVATDDPHRGADQLAALAQIGVTRFVTGGRYADAAAFQRIVDGLVAVREAGG